MSCSPDPHATRSALEAALCAEMRARDVPHEHRSLHFRVRLPSGETVQYAPAVVARRGAILFLVEPVEGPGAGAPRLEVLAAFLDQHSPEIVLIAVAPRDGMGHIASSSYDEVYPSEDVAAVVRRIREQDPRGMVRPFSKPKG